jgi:hypothetical protein
MLVIGELINGMFKNVAKAIREKDASVIRKVASDQVKAGDRRRWISIAALHRKIPVPICRGSSKPSKA